MTFSDILRSLWLFAAVGLVFAVSGDPVLGHCRPDETVKLLPASGAARDQFGAAASVHGDLTAIGARFDADNGVDSGAAYVFRFEHGPPGGWYEEAKLLAYDGAPYDSFGRAIAIWGDTVVVGASGRDENGADSGVVYIFRFDGSNWALEQKLIPSDNAVGDFFGYTVAISEDVVAIGAYWDDDNGGNSGSVYVYRFDGATWVQEQKLTSSDGDGGDQFGVSVALAGDPWWRLVIGAYADDDLGAYTGSAYVFRYDAGAPGSWVQEGKLVANDRAAGDMFGWAVGATGGPLGRMVIGAYGNDDFGPQTGSAYIFRLDGANWVQEQKLLASDGSTGRIFGKSLGASGDIALIGSHRDLEQGNYSGAAFAFRYNGSSWIEEAKLLPTDGEGLDRFAWSVAISGGTAAIGAHRNDDLGIDSGSAYIFRGLADCNSSGTLDLCDLAVGTSQDYNVNGIPDECDRSVPTISGTGSWVMAGLLVLVAATVLNRRRLSAGEAR